MYHSTLGWRVIKKKKKYLSKLLDDKGAHPEFVQILLHFLRRERECVCEREWRNARERVREMKKIERKKGRESVSERERERGVGRKREGERDRERESECECE